MDFTDIRRDGIIKSLPLSWQPYALLVRLDRPIGWWLLLLPGWWAIALAGGGVNDMGGREWYLLFLFLLGSILMRSAGCIVNDLWDRDFDAQVERTKTRPLASGEIKPWQAAIFLVVLLFCSLVILIQTNAATFWIGILSLVFVGIYPYMKRITWWPQAFLGLTFNFGVPMGWAAVTNGLDWSILFLYAGAFFWTLGYDTIYAHQDKDDDQMIGVKSTALLFGERSKKWVGIFYAASWFLIAIGTFFATGSIATYGLLLLPGVHMALQIMLWKMGEQESSLKIFKSNKLCGLLFFLAFLAS
jgi:4-hydroxybenzoate polyprenyltransferase